MDTILAICLPAANEGASLPRLLAEIDDALVGLESTSAVIVVFDDGSEDNTSDVIKDVVLRHANLHYLRSRVRRGKSYALQKSLEYSLHFGANQLLTMDADGQDNPVEIPKMLRALDAGFDVVSGQRLGRQDRRLKIFSSRLFNGLARAVSGTKVMDINSGFKGFSRPAAEKLCQFYYGEMHRVILIIGIWLGLSVENIPITNRSRFAGSSKYGPLRGFRGVFDLLTVRGLIRYQGRPGHLFGWVATALMAAGLSLLASGLFFGLEGVSQAVTLVTGATAVVASTIFIGFGFLSEILTFESTPPTSGLVTTWVSKQ